MRIVVINHLTLDGVMLAPGRAHEDTRGGFQHGGWASAATATPDPDIGAALGARMAESDGLLLGRRTYEDLLTSWNAQGGPFKDALNNATKYVASATLTEPLPWPNSALLGANVIEPDAARSGWSPIGTPIDPSGILSERQAGGLGCRSARWARRKTS